MPDVIAQGAAWLAEQRDQHMSREVVLVQPGGATHAFLASIGRTEFELTDAAGEPGIGSRIQTRDFIGTLAVEPQHGDRIRETVGDQVHVHEVGAVADLPCWSWADSYRTARRIHTRFIRTEPA